VPDEDYLRLKKYISIHFKIHWELDSYSQKLPPYERIKGFVLTSEALPRTRLGKLIRYKIAEKFSAGAFKEEAKKAVTPEKLSNFEELALQYISKILKKDVRIDDHLELDLGLDSLGRIELLSALQDVVNVGIDDSLALELFQARSIRELITKSHQALPEDTFKGFLKREDTIFWSEALKEPPSKQTRAKLKLHFDLFDKFVSLVEIMILRFFFRIVFSLTIKGKANIPNAGPFVIVANHVSYLDAFYVACALPYKLLLNTYFVGFGDIFNHPLISWAVRFNRLIPIDTNLNLAETLRACSYVLEKGKILVYFPEGQRSIDGKTKEFRKGIGILAKEANAKVLPVYLEGAYKAWPRTRLLPLPSPVTVKIGGHLEVSRLSLREGEDPYVAIAEVLKAKVSELEKAPSSLNHAPLL
jgi:long-chain acyl-CoA synthetase